MIETKKPAEKLNENKFAVIETGGKQYLVKPGSKIKIEKVEKPDLPAGEARKETGLVFDKVLLVVKEKNIEIGTPYVKDAKITAEWLAEKRARKITNVRYKSKTRRSRKQGHRQIYTEVLVLDF